MAIEIHQFLEHVQADFAKRRGRQLGKLVAQVVLNTPVKTGQLAGNWNFTFGGMPSNRIENYKKGKRTTGANPTTQHNLEKYSNPQFKGHSKDSFFVLSNNLPYAEIIVNEHKEAKGFVRRAMRQSTKAFNLK